MGIEVKGVEFAKGAHYEEGIEPTLVRDWSVAEEKKAKRK